MGPALLGCCPGPVTFLSHRASTPRMGMHVIFCPCPLQCWALGLSGLALAPEHSLRQLAWHGVSDQPPVCNEIARIPVQGVQLHDVIVFSGSQCSLMWGWLPGRPVLPKSVMQAGPRAGLLQTPRPPDPRTGLPPAPLPGPRATWKTHQKLEEQSLVLSSLLTTVVNDVW